MRSEISFIEQLRLIRLAAFLWIGYLAVLAVIDESLWDPRHINTQIFYYSFLGLVALLCLILAYWPWIQEKLRKVFLPVIITIITVLPLICTWVIIAFFPHHSQLDATAMIIRLLPFLITGFLMIGWQYKWQYMLPVILGIAGLNVGIIWSNPTSTPPVFPRDLAAPLIQTVVFLAVGFSIGYLMNRIRNQQSSLETANIRLTHYTSTLEQLAVTRERNRLARELHDTLAHSLSGLSVQLETVKAYWDVDQKMARSSLDLSLAVVHSGLEETRRALKALRASPLEDLGLAQAIKALAEDAAARGNLTLDLIITDKMPVLSPDMEQCIYRIAQEAITNVVSHAHAKNLTVKLESAPGKLILVIHDDGVGFDIEKVNKSSQFGLTGMQERVQLAGGDLNIISKPGHGTTIQLTLSVES